MSEHTPAPWIMYDKDEYGTCSIAQVRDVTNLVIARTSTPVDGDEEANAHLIAAAPELLDALDDFISGASTGAITSDHDETFEYLIKRSKRAIAKARGEHA